MYLISNPRIPMSKGKFGAQCGHATMRALELSPDNWLKHVWRHAGGHYAKVVLMADDLMLAKHYIEERGFACALVLDEGRTEFGDELTPTFLGVQIVDKDLLDVKNTFGQFKLYREPELEDPALVIVKEPVKRTVKDWIKERFNYGNSPQRDS